MIKALAIKELRESAGLVALAGMGMLWTVAAFMGVNPLQAFTGTLANEYTIPFIQNDIYGWFCLFLGGLAITLGLKQTAWEHGRDTYYFLLWRPIDRHLVMIAKIAVGLLLILGFLVASILAYGMWASTPGTRMGPFEWSMTAEAWKLALPLSLVYLGAFISGLRPARWFGTRLVPLACALVWSTLAFVAPYYWVSLPFAALGLCFAIATINYFAETSDF